METISQDPDSHLYARELEELHRFKSTSQAESEARNYQNRDGLEVGKDGNGREKF